MGRAYQVRKAAMEKTAAAKTKVYSRYGREIYLAAKEGVPDPEMNTSLKRVIEKAKKDEVPSDIIKRAIDKAKSGAADNMVTVTYEGFGPGASTIIVDCLTDNVNRSFSAVRGAFSKSYSKIGLPGSVAHNYDHVSMVSIKGISEDKVLESLLNAEIDVKSIETEGDTLIVIGHPNDLKPIRNTLAKDFPKAEFDLETVSYNAPEDVTLEGDSLTHFQRLLDLLDEIEDVQNVYHNVNLG